MKKDTDHWAFLDDIEAPMWVDLAAEAKLSNKESNDEWFHRSHKFHQLPSRKLKEAFKHIDSGGKLELDTGGSSPKLPSSVSKSRGKCYENDKVGIEFRLSLSANDCVTKDADDEALQSQCGNEVLPKSAHENSKSSLHLDREDVTGSAVINVINTNTLPSLNYTSSLNQLEHNVGVSDPQSSITNESALGAEVVVASNHIIGRRSQLLSVIRQSLRKSCTTRTAVRGQITNAQQSNCLRASSGKSSVGSFSVHSLEAKDIITDGVQRTSRTPESKNIVRLSQESKTRNNGKTSIADECRSSNMYNTSDCANNGQEPRIEPALTSKTNVKLGSIYSRGTLKRDGLHTSTSLKIKINNRASGCDNREKVGMLKNLKTSTAAKAAQCLKNNGHTSKLSKSSTDHAVPEYSMKQKVTAPKGSMSRFSGKDSVSTEVGKSKVTKSTQPQKVMPSKEAPLIHRRPLAQINKNDQGSQRRPLAPTFARKTMMRGQSDASTQSNGQGKENIVSMVTSRRQGNGKGIASRGMAEKSNKTKQNEA